MKTILIGSAGKMATAILSTTKNQINYTYLLDKKNKNSFDNKIKSINDLKDADPKEIDIVIDFATQSSLQQTLDFCKKNKKKLLIGSTGFSKQDIDNLKKLSNNVACFYAPNFSLVVNLLKKLAFIVNKQDAVENIDIIESHHKYKKDAPSGSALLLGEPLDKDKVNYHSLRRANIIGEHAVIFSFANETLKLEHTAHSRDAFVDGVIKAYEFLKNKNSGFFTMDSLLNL